MNGIPRDLLEAMKQISKPAMAPKKSREELPWVNTESLSPEVLEACRRIEALFKLTDDQKARIESDKAIISDACRKEVLRVSRENGRVTQTIRIGGLVYTMRKKARPHDRVYPQGSELETIKAQFGTHFQSSFVEESEFKWHPEKLTPELLRQLHAVGAVEVVDFLSPTDALHDLRILNAEVEAAASDWVPTQDQLQLFKEKKS